MITNNGFAKGNYKVVTFLQIVIGTVQATTFEDSGHVGNSGLVKTLIPNFHFRSEGVGRDGAAPDQRQKGADGRLHVHRPQQRPARSQQEDCAQRSL